MKRLITTSIVLLLFSASMAWAQSFTVSGVIKDLDSGQPVDYATVIQDNLRVSFTWSTSMLLRSPVLMTAV